jgi:hypothetical protein
MKRKRNNNINAGIAKKLVMAASKADLAKNKARQTPEAREAREKQEQLAQLIAQSAESAKTVEDLIYIERSLQDIDTLQAVTPHDQTGIANAKREYRQIADTVDQMRRAPDEYFKANQSMKETGGDFKKIPRSRGLQQISGNKARLQNRASFAVADERKVWEARIALADKTEGMVKTLHRNLAANFAGKQKITAESGQQTD